MGGVQAIAGAGFDWKFSEVAVLGAGFSGFLIRSMSVVVSIGGMLITALLLGIVSGACQPACCCTRPVSSLPETRSARLWCCPERRAHTRNLASPKLVQMSCIGVCQAGKAGLVPMDCALVLTTVSWCLDLS